MHSVGTHNGTAATVKVLTLVLAMQQSSYDKAFNTALKSFWIRSAAELLWHSTWLEMSALNVTLYKLQPWQKFFKIRFLRFYRFTDLHTSSKFIPLSLREARTL